MIYHLIVSCFELILEKTLGSLEENGINFVLKAKQKKAIEQFYEKKDLLAFSPSCVARKES